MAAQEGLVLPSDPGASPSKDLWLLQPSRDIIRKNNVEFDFLFHLGESALQFKSLSKLPVWEEKGQFFFS